MASALASAMTLMSVSALVKVLERVLKGYPEPSDGSRSYLPLC